MAALGFSGKRPPLGTVIGTVQEINVFPGKSMRAVSKTHVKINANGLQGDRLFMVVDLRKVPMTQRQIPDLARIQVDHINDESKQVIRLVHPDYENDLRLDLNSILAASSQKSGSFTVDLHGIKSQCVVLSEAANAWISTVLNKPGQLHLVTMMSSGEHNNNNEVVRKAYLSATHLVMPHLEKFDGMYLSDLAPISLTCTASLAKVNEHATEIVDMTRFRANIVVDTGSGEQAFLEDHVLKLEIGDNNAGRSLRTIGPTFRCVIPSVNQETGEAGFRKNLKTAEPISTLKRLRSGGLRFGITGFLPTDMGGSGSLAPLFGLYMGVDSQQSTLDIKVGDKVRVTEYYPAPSAVSSLFAGSGSHWFILFLAIFILLCLHFFQF